MTELDSVIHIPALEQATVAPLSINIDECTDGIEARGRSVLTMHRKLLSMYIVRQQNELTTRRWRSPCQLQMGSSMSLRCSPEMSPQHKYPMVDHQPKSMRCTPGVLAWLGVLLVKFVLE